MKFLLDTSTEKVKNKVAQFPGLVAGQLLTPLTAYKNWGGTFAIDNGAFSEFNGRAYQSLLETNKTYSSRCLFATLPDVVGSARRTAEMMGVWYEKLYPYRIALVAQDGIEDLPIQWDMLDAIFIGGSTEWKESSHAIDVVKAGIIAGVHVHIGRVNQIKRFQKFLEAGADTCDGSGVSRFDEKLLQIRNKVEAPRLFND